MGCDVRVSGLLRRNLQPTLTYWSVFFSFGLCIAFLGPTLLDLRCQTRSSLPAISWVFFSSLARKSPIEDRILLKGEVKEKNFSLLQVPALA